MTKIKALRDFLEKFFNYKSHGMTISEVLADVTENGEASGGGGYEPVRISHPLVM